jgi:hypothetical protein
MYDLYNYNPSHSEKAEGQDLSKKSEKRNGNDLKIKSRSIQNWNNLLSRRAWFVVDRGNNKIVNGPFESSKIATLYLEEHESLCSQCVMNGSEILKKYQIHIGLPRKGRFK